MAVRQYIGARYVPLYAGDWDATKNYEPLTIVTDANGNSFTSLKDVPAGTALTDRNYWIQTSSFSGAVDVLRRDVNTLQDDVSALQTDVSGLQTNVSGIETDVAAIKRHYNKKILLFGDSVAAGNVVSPSFANMIKTVYPNTSIYALPGGSWGKEAKYLTQLETAISEISDKESIDIIMIAAGFNDGLTATWTLSNADADIAEFVTRAKQQFINAEIMCIDCAWAKLAPSRTTFLRDVSRVFDLCKKYGCGVWHIGYLALHKYGNNFESDDFHPSAAGNRSLADAILSILSTGTVQNQQFQYGAGLNLTLASGITISGSAFTVGEYSTPNGLAFFIPDMTVTFASAQTRDADIVIGTADFQYFDALSRGTSAAVIPLMIDQGAGTSIEVTNGYIWIKNGQMYVRVMSINTTFTRIYFRQTTIEFNAMYN